MVGAGRTCTDGRRGIDELNEIRFVPNEMRLDVRRDIRRDMRRDIRRNAFSNDEYDIFGLT